MWHATFTRVEIIVFEFYEKIITMLGKTILFCIYGSCYCPVGNLVTLMMSALCCLSLGATFSSHVTALTCLSPATNIKTCVTSLRQRTQPCPLTKHVSHFHSKMCGWGQEKTTTMLGKRKTLWQNIGSESVSWDYGALLTLTGLGFLAFCFLFSLLKFSSLLLFSPFLSSSDELYEQC